MDNQNRYESVPQKENIFLKIIKMFVTYIKNLFYDFFTSFKYNNMKLAGILIAVPGVFIGFFMGIHAAVINRVVYTVMESKDTGEFIYYKLTFDITGMTLFLMMLAGILNIFTGVTLMGKKNLGSVVLATLTTVFIVASGVLYLYALSVYFEGIDVYEKWRAANPDVELTFDSVKAIGADVIGIPIQADSPKVENGNLILSVGSVIISMVCPVAGCVIGFIKYDRTYEKVNR